MTTMAFFFFFCRTGSEIADMLLVTCNLHDFKVEAFIIREC